MTVTGRFEISIILKLENPTLYTESMQVGEEYSKIEMKEIQEFTRKLHLFENEMENHMIFWEMHVPAWIDSLYLNKTRRDQILAKNTILQNIMKCALQILKRDDDENDDVLLKKTLIVIKHLFHVGKKKQVTSLPYYHNRLSSQLNNDMDTNQIQQAYHAATYTTIATCIKEDEDSIGSILFALNVNYYAECGGFRIMKSRIATCSLVELSLYLEIWKTSLFVLLPDFISCYFTSCLLLLYVRLIELPITEWEKKTSRVDAILAQVQTLETAALEEDTVVDYTSLFQHVVEQSLTSTCCDVRAFGLKHLNEMITSVHKSNSTSSQHFIYECKSEFNRNDLIEWITTTSLDMKSLIPCTKLPSTYCPQLFLFLHFYVSNIGLTKQHLVLLFKMVSQSSTSRKDRALVYQIIADLSRYMHVEVIIELNTLLKDLNPRDECVIDLVRMVTLGYIDLLCSTNTLEQNVYKEFIQCGLILLWDWSLLPKAALNAEKSLLFLISKGHCDTSLLIKHGLVNLQRGEESILTLRMLQTIIIPTEIVKWETKYCLVQLAVDDLHRYMTRQMILSRSREVQNILLPDEEFRVAHSLSFLAFLVQQSSLTFHFPQLQQIWDCIHPFPVLYRWLTGLLSSSQMSLTQPVLKLLYTECFCTALFMTTLCIPSVNAFVSFAAHQNKGKKVIDDWLGLDMYWNILEGAPEDDTAWVIRCALLSLYIESEVTTSSSSSLVGVSLLNMATSRIDDVDITEPTQLLKIARLIEILSAFLYANRENKHPSCLLYYKALHLHFERFYSWLALHPILVAPIWCLFKTLPLDSTRLNEVENPCEEMDWNNYFEVSCLPHFHYQLLVLKHLMDTGEMKDATLLALFPSLQRHWIEMDILDILSKQKDDALLIWDFYTLLTILIVHCIDHLKEDGIVVEEERVAIRCETLIVSFSHEDSTISKSNNSVEKNTIKEASSSEVLRAPLLDGDSMGRDKWVISLWVKILASEKLGRYTQVHPKNHIFLLHPSSLLIPLIECTDVKTRKLMCCALHQLGQFHPTWTAPLLWLLMQNVTRVFSGYGAEFFHLVSLLISAMDEQHIDSTKVSTFSPTDACDVLYKAMTHPRLCETSSTVPHEILQNVMRVYLILFQKIDISSRKSMKNLKNVVTLLLDEYLFGYAIVKTRPDVIELPRCKHRTTRVLAYRLVAAMYTSAREVIVQFLSSQHTIVLDAIPPLPTLQPRMPFIGLTNLGCTCYLNAVLQVCFLLPPFREMILMPNDALTGAFAYEIQRCFVYLIGSVRESVTPLRLIKSLSSKLNVNRQEDASEFLTTLLLDIEVSFKGTWMEKALDFMTGSFSNELYVPHSSSPRCYLERKEIFHFISVPVLNMSNLTASLRAFTAPEIVQYIWEGTKTSMATCKRMCIQQLPDILWIHLKRFDFDPHNMQQSKIHDRFDFPILLDMYPHTQEGLSSSSNFHRKHPLNYYKYHLTGVIIHIGTAQSGHYVSIVYDKNAEGWFEFNDTDVNRIQVNQIPKKCYGGQEKKGANNVKANRQSAFLLVYSRMAPEKKTNGKVSSNVGVNTDVSSRSTPQLSTSVWCMVFLGRLRHRIKRRLKLVSGIRQNALLHVSSDIVQDLLQDNLSIQRQKYLLSLPYFDFLSTTLLNNNDKNIVPRSEEAYSTILHLVWGTLWQEGKFKRMKLYHTYVLESLSHVNVAREFVLILMHHPHCFVEWIGANENIKPSAVYSECLASVCTCMTTLCENEETTLIHALMKCLWNSSIVSFASSPLSVFSGAILQLFLHYARLSGDARQVLLEENVLPSLLELTSHLPKDPFHVSQLWQLISILIRSTRTEKENEDSTKEAVKDSAGDSKEDDEDSLEDFYEALAEVNVEDSKDDQDSFTPVFNNPYAIAPQTILPVSLTQHVHTTRFLNALIREMHVASLLRTELSLLLQYLSWKDLETSRHLLRLITTGLESQPFDQLKCYFRTFRALVQMKDEFSRKRLDDGCTSILGILASQQDYFKRTAIGLEMVLRLIHVDQKIALWMKIEIPNLKWIEGWLIGHKNNHRHDITLVKPMPGNITTSAVYLQWSRVKVDSSRWLLGIQEDVRSLLPRLRHFLSSADLPEQEWQQESIQSGYHSDLEPTVLLGERISVQWAKGKWYSGQIKEYNLNTGKHFVQYDDGEQRMYYLSEKQFQIL